MRILITNDDGIFAPGIEILARHAQRFGEVTVVAPAAQCSAMSQRITIDRPLHLTEYDFPVSGVRAYSVDGTPADCIKVSMDYIFPEKPDIVFSGVNYGFNIGIDIAYSGTVGAAVEALMYGVPAMAFSRCLKGDSRILEKNLSDVIEELLKTPISSHELWNVNFPGCAPEKFNGIMRERRVSDRAGFYNGKLMRDETRSDGIYLVPVDNVLDYGNVDPDTDLYAALQYCISIGKYRPGVL